MLYDLLYDLRGYWAPLHVFKYITFRTLVAGLTALSLSLLLGPIVIRRLVALQIGQSIREDGPAAHAKKRGTPTMGGMLILFTLALSTLLLADPSEPYVWIALGVTLAHGLIGFFDDWAKVRKRNSRGVPGRLRLGTELLIGGIAAALIYLVSEHGGHITMPFLKHVRPDLGLLYIPFGAIVIAGTANAVNLTDGLDGLAIGPVMVAAATYAVFAYAAGNVIFADYLQIPHVRGAGELTVFCGALVAAGLGFLWFNAYPAQMFMGDVGSLALGGALGTVAVLIKQELLIPIVGGVFVLEGLSVIIQVGSYKLRGKRVFKMAPLHHHFEKIGWQEPTVITRFLILAIIFALLSLLTLKLR